ncbi:MAG: cytidine deaminase [Clostridia bacterium]|nr:cytidine deaminase [Clostridia bacterium]
MIDKKLCEQAVLATKNSYSPYSSFKVGAALLCADGSIFTGCNIENSSFTPTVCAERVAVFKAISEGKRDFDSIAIAGGKDGFVGSEICTPCGVCLQVLSEFCNPDKFNILLVKDGGFEKYTLRELLPKSFKLE